MTQILNWRGLVDFKCVHPGGRPVLASLQTTTHALNEYHRPGITNSLEVETEAKQSA